MNSVTISVRIPRELKKKIDSYGIKISEVVRKALEEEVRRRELEEAVKAAEELRELFSRIPDEEIVRVIKEYRRTK